MVRPLATTLRVAIIASLLIACSGPDDAAEASGDLTSEAQAIVGPATDVITECGWAADPNGGHACWAGGSACVSSCSPPYCDPYDDPTNGGCLDYDCASSVCASGAARATSHTDIAEAIGAVGRVLSFDDDDPTSGRASGASACSGTLIERNLVLTAAHCVLEIGSQRFSSASVANNNAEYVVFNLPQDPETLYPGASIQMIPDDPYDVVDGSGGDIALITLQDEVPESVVAKPLGVFVGDILNGGLFGESASLDGEHVYQIGFGAVDFLSTGGGLFRRYGKMHKPFFKRSCPGACLGVKFVGAAGFAKGDSGGPMLARDKDSQRYYVIGVASGIHVWNADWWGKVATTGNMSRTVDDITYRVTNGDWIAARMLDGDEDGIFDNIDNCPSNVCKGRPLACANTDQLDTDQDGVGDRCDNCSPSRIENLVAANPAAPTIFTAYNPEQRDQDDDGIGDTCDLCYDTYSPGNLDSDSDLYGDECDYCDSTPEPVGRTCSDDFDCGVFQSCQEINREDGTIVGRCSNDLNTDYDDFGDVCDHCPSVYTEDGANRNSNAFAEAFAVADERGDDCDVVPLIRTEPQEFETVVIGAAGNPDPVNQVAISGESWLGWYGQGVLRFAAPYSFRHCTCVDSFGYRQAPEHCATHGGTCMPDQWASNWKLITLHDQSGQQLSQPLPSIVFDQADPHPVKYNWRWRSDALGGVVHNLGGEQNPQTYGLLGAKIERHLYIEPPANEPSRDTEILRVATQLYETPFFAYMLHEPGFVARSCTHPACLLWFARPWEERVNPDPVDLVSTRYEPAAIAWNASSPVLLAGGGVAAASGIVSTDIAQLLSRRDLTWLRPEELAAALPPGSEAMGAVIGPYSAPILPGKYIASNGAIGLSLAGTGGLPTTAWDAVAVPEGGRAIYSAREDSIYVVGGKINGVPTELIRQFAFADGSWAPVAWGFAHSPSDRILAVEYRSERRELFVLDVLGQTGEETARLVRYDLKSAVSQILWSVPYTGQYQTLDLVKGDGSTLLLVASTPSQWRVWRMDPSAAGVTFDGWLESPGSVADVVVTGVRDRYVPVLAGGILRPVAVRSLALIPGGFCSSL